MEKIGVCALIFVIAVLFSSPFTVRDYYEADNKIKYTIVMMLSSIIVIAMILVLG